jgi:hypothetical protein
MRVTCSTPVVAVAGLAQDRAPTPAIHATLLGAGLGYLAIAPIAMAVRVRTARAPIAGLATAAVVAGVLVAAVTVGTSWSLGEDALLQIVGCVGLIATTVGERLARQAERL